VLAAAVHGTPTRVHVAPTGSAWASVPNGSAWAALTNGSAWAGTITITPSGSAWA
jgi:hypothetical protein